MNRLIMSDNYLLIDISKNLNLTNRLLHVYGKCCYLLRQYVSKCLLFCNCFHRYFSTPVVAHHQSPLSRISSTLLLHNSQTCTHHQVQGNMCLKTINVTKERFKLPSNVDQDNYTPLDRRDEAMLFFTFEQLTKCINMKHI